VTDLKSDPAIRAIDEFIASQQIDKTAPGWRTRLTKPPKVEFDANRSYFWDVRTNKGNVRVKFLPDVAPMHVSSTIYLTRLGYYDGLIFHRVIPGFMAQGGCPEGKGSGGPGYEYDGEFSPQVRHDRGALLSMANRGAGTDGSQFFLTFKETPWLDDKHTIFGEVVDGTKTLEVLEYFGTQGGAPKTELFMESCSISIE